MVKDQSRRTFLRTAPLAAVSLSLTDELLAQSAPTAPSAPFQSYTAEQLTAAAKALQAKPGDKSLFTAAGIPLTAVLTLEVAKSAKEFEWHEGRDHVVQIVDGSTLYEVGGTPEGAHSSKPGEWNAPTSKGSKSIMMGKGDVLVIPRGTPHKRSTEDSVTFTLVSSTGMLM